MKTISIPNAMTPEDGIVIGGQPSAAEFRAARDAGFETVINLRSSAEPGVAEQAGALATMGFAYHHLPIAGANGVTVENAKAFAALVDGAERPLLIHCGSGNRIGALAAMRAFHLDGKDAAEALRIGRAWGLTALEPVVQSKLSR